MGPLVLPGIYAVTKGLAIIQIGILALQAVVVTYMYVNGSDEDGKLNKIDGYRSDHNSQKNTIIPGSYTSISYNGSVESPWIKNQVINLNLENYHNLYQSDKCTSFKRYINLCLEIQSIHFKIKDTYTTDRFICQQKECKFHITYETSPKYNNLFKDEKMFYKLTGIKTIFNTPIRTTNVFHTGQGKHTAWWQPVLLNLMGGVVYKDSRDDEIIDSGLFEMDVYQFEQGSIVGFGGIN